jgi:hypothetical protein
MRLLPLSQDRMISIVTKLDDRGIGVRFPANTKGFSFFSPHRPDGPWGTSRLIQWVSRAAFWEVKRSGGESDHSPISSVDVKSTWSYTSIPHTSSWSEKRTHFCLCPTEVEVHELQHEVIVCYECCIEDWVEDGCTELRTELNYKVQNFYY